MLWIVVELLTEGEIKSATIGKPLFSLDSTLPVEQDIAESLAAIQNARRIGLLHCQGVVDFDPWQSQVTAEQLTWAEQRRVPSTRSSLGLELLFSPTVAALSNPPDRLVDWVKTQVEPLNDWIKRGGFSELS
jgi:hypothetical protein